MSQQQPMTDQLFAPANGRNFCKNGAPLVPGSLCSPVSEITTGTCAEMACTAGQLSGMLQVLATLFHPPSVKVAPTPAPVVEAWATGAVGSEVCKYTPPEVTETPVTAPL